MPKLVGKLKLFEVKELSELLDVQPSTIRKYLREGKINGRKFAGRWFVPEDFIENFFKVYSKHNNIDGGMGG